MYRIYFTNEYGEARFYNEDNLTQALATAEGLRKHKRYSFVVMTSQDPNCTSLAGVDSVEHMQLPDGSNYEWKKRRN